MASCHPYKHHDSLPLLLLRALESLCPMAEGVCVVLCWWSAWWKKLGGEEEEVWLAALLGLLRLHKSPGYLSHACYSVYREGVRVSVSSVCSVLCVCSSPNLAYLSSRHTRQQLISSLAHSKCRLCVNSPSPSHSPHTPHAQTQSRQATGIV